MTNYIFKVQTLSTKPCLWQT